MSEDRRTVLTTGANSGSGLAIVLELARRGFRSVGSVRSAAKGELVAGAAAEAGVEVETVLLDVDDADAAAAVVDELRPWAVVNNAGFVRHLAVEDTDDATARAYLETHAIAPMRLARLALPHMRAQGGGRIVQVSSIAGRTTFPLLGWYQASKHALEAASDALRNEVVRDGIHVSIVEPGSFESGITEEMVEEDGDDGRYADAYRRAARQFAMLRPLWASPEQVARAVAGALTARTPRPRYLVGIDARVNALTEPFTPTVVRDRVLRFLTGL